ncbi:MAG: molybdopterin-dependent oxidoreductase [Dehalococcoidales bacterium]
MAQTGLVQVKDFIFKQDITEGVKAMAKCKNLILGFGFAVTTTVMWLVSSCSPTATNSVPVAQTVTSPLPDVSSTTPEPPNNGNSNTTIATLTPDNSALTTTATTFNEDIDINSYNLTIDGTVNSPLSLTYAQIQAYPTVTRNAEIICPGVKDETDSWTGVSLSTLLKEAGLATGASEVVFTGADGYFVQLPLETVLESGVFLAYKMNGQILSQDRGYPLRLVVGKSQGADWLRWVTKIEVKPALVSFENSSAILQKLSNNIPTFGSKLCSCLLTAVITKRRS